MNFCHIIRWSIISLATLVFLVAGNGIVRADVLALKNGGRIQGELVEANDDQSSSYVISTVNGGRVAVPKTEVERFITQTPTEEEYDKRAASISDKVDAHWQLAQWCREQNLRDEYREQLSRILELDPNHEQARQALGFQKKNGQWVTRDDVMTARGLVLYNGKYYTQQHIDLVEHAKQAKLTAAQWRDRLDRWRRWLTSRRQDRAEEALREIRAIQDPSAAPAIVDMLRHEDDPAVKHLLIEVAARLDSQAAVDELVELSMADPNEEVRYECLELLIRSGRPGIAMPFIRMLQDSDNMAVNRAAEALKTIGDREAMGPLIDALVTKHKAVVGEGAPKQDTYVFTPSGGSGMTFGGGGPKVVSREVENQSVLAALVKLSGGVNYSYDQKQWRAWLAAQAKAHPVDVRRDP